ncbi:MAG: hypothetical protein ACI9HK_005026, partial [Pirellulaceae bacterium]
MKQFSRALTVVLIVTAFSSAVRGADLAKADIDFFEKKIRPVLVKHCYECHSAKSQEVGGKLLLDSRDGILQGGESGPALVAGKPDDSLIIQSLRYQDTEMPPEKPLPESVVNDFVGWVLRGAPDPRFDAKEVTPKVTNDAENLNPDKHWSFYPRQA